MIRIDTSELDRFSVDVGKLSDKTKGNVQKVLNNTGFKIETKAKGNVPVDTGHLRRGITTKIGDMEVIVHTSNIKYARGVEFGTRPHLIKPKNKKALYWKGAKHPVKVVKHKGSRAKPYLIPAFEHTKNDFINDLKEVIEW
jgi:HK97 gp10 family phage protein